MNRRTHTHVPVALTLALACGLPTTLALAQQGGEPVNGETLLPVREVTLYRSGVGAFERQGLIDGSSTVALRFETDQINDILKSMVLLDLDGGRVSAVGYGSQEPLERRLASFAIDLSGNPSVVELLRQLRGADVELRTIDGRVAGRIVSTETRQVKADDGASAGTAEFVTVLTTQGEIVSIRMDSVRSFRLADADLQEELTRAMAALGESRADRTKSVELRFDGQPGRARRVIVAYVTEMPVWKTSYRLVLDEGEDDPSIYGWAIVENTTDHDWTNVTLSLASGRPVSFTMDLYQPLFAERPEVPVPFLAGVAPQLYESALNAAPPETRARRSVLGRGGSGGDDALPDAAMELERSEAGQTAAFDYEGGLAQYLPSAAASAGTAGEQFLYTVDAPVTIERQRSAMLPILSSTIEGRRVSIYSPRVNATNPMRGVELTNDSGLHLMPGPIAVYDAGTYAGDAQIPHTSRNQTRLLSYAVDLPVRCETNTTSDYSVTGVKIDNGVLVMTSKNVVETSYTAQNMDDTKGRTLLVEHPRRAGWELVSDVEHEPLSDIYRVELEIGPSDSESVTLREEYVSGSRYELVSYNEAQLALLVRRGVASQAVLSAFREAGAMKAAIADLERRIDQARNELEEIDRDQRRLRENIKTVREGSELYTRYLDKLTEQEDRIEALNSSIRTWQEQLASQQRRLQEYLRNLDVE